MYAAEQRVENQITLTGSRLFLFFRLLIARSKLERMFYTQGMR